MIGAIKIFCIDVLLFLRTFKGYLLILNNLCISLTVQIQNFLDLKIINPYIFKK